ASYGDSTVTSQICSVCIQGDEHRSTGRYSYRQTSRQVDCGSACTWNRECSRRCRAFDYSGQRTSSVIVQFKHLVSVRYECERIRSTQGITSCGDFSAARC